MADRMDGHSTSRKGRVMAESLKAVMAFFGMTAKEMVKEWKALTQEDRDQIRNGIEDGSLTY